MKNLQHNRAALRFITAVTFLFLAASCQAAGKMPRGSYLRRPAPSVASLVQQTKDDPLVMERYARLFRMAPPLVRDAFTQMRLSRMKKDQISRVYYAHPDEKLGYRLRRVKKGTLVFVLPDGSPALVQVCGNPMRADLKFTRAHAVAGRTLIKDFSPLDEEEALAAGPIETDETMTGLQTADANSGGGAGRAATPDIEWSGPGGSDAGFIPDAAGPAPGFVPAASGIGSSGGGAAGGGGLGGAALTGLAGLTAWLASAGGSGGSYQPAGSGTVPGGGGSGGGVSGFGGGSSGGSGGAGSGGGSGGGGGYTSVVPESDAMTLLIFALLGVGLAQIVAWQRARRQTANHDS